MKHRRFRILKEMIRGGEAVSRDAAEIRHMTRVLRLGPGDPVTLFDGEGGEYPALISSISADEVVFSLLPAHGQGSRESSLSITLGVALLKSSRFEWLLEKATELGVSEIAPFFSRYVVVKDREENRAKHLERWRKIVSEAAKQSGRSKVPEVREPRDFEKILSLDFPGPRIFLWEREEKTNLRMALEKPFSSVMALVGPEGGFSEDEARRAIGSGFTPVRLGPRTLRAETAGIMIVGLLQFLYGDMT
ncbi:MAG TPA: 16S rRNA (uracil(1498)-N(3))-methyltransferase [Thermodesulfobacteriota bacterium]|nr:16S rRNA (uracil(1498)-N(3))-methyltransferase [Thermodesulfobacteriota bacterium]